MLLPPTRRPNPAMWNIRCQPALPRGQFSFAFTSYLSGLLYFVGRNAEGGINVHQAALPKAMGLGSVATAIPASP